MPILYKLRQNNRKNSPQKGKWYARAVHTGTIDIAGLATIMQANCTVKAADIKAVLTELSETMATQLQNSMRVKIDGLGAFKIGLCTKPAESAADFTVGANVKGMRVNFLPETKISPNKIRSRAMLDGAKVVEAPKNAVVTSKDKPVVNPPAGGGTDTGGTDTGGGDNIG